MGDSQTEMSDVRSLTAVEESMAELLFAEFLQALGEAWPGAESLSCRVIDTVHQPERTRMFPPRTTLVVTTLQIRVRSTADENAGAGRAAGAPQAKDDRAASDLSPGEIVWIMPQEDIEDLIEIECETPAPQLTKPHPAIPRIMRDVPVSLKVELGRTHLLMSELTSLELGDVVILEQSVNRPLNIFIGDTVKFRGRPGRIGSRRCLEIQHVLEDAPGTSPASRPN
jgi:flagellar motor switch protein FliM